jgi:tRNA modification GTPase
MVFDAERPEEAAAIHGLIDRRAIIVVNKIDLLSAGVGIKWADELGETPASPLSVRTGTGVPALIERLTAAVGDLMGEGGIAPLVTRARHRQALEDCVAALDRFGTATLPELAAEDLRRAARALGRITGRVDVEDMLDALFREFCIGK